MEEKFGDVVVELLYPQLDVSDSSWVWKKSSLLLDGSYSTLSEFSRVSIKSPNTKWEIKRERMSHKMKINFYI